MCRFLPAPSARRATEHTVVLVCSCVISIHALREEGDVMQFAAFPGAGISIHALREEGDASASSTSTAPPNFYPRPPRGGRPPTPKLLSRRRYFYPRPPRGGRRDGQSRSQTNRKFLSTPSARRATGSPPGQDREHQRFLSTPSARRATAKTETKSLFSNKLYNILHEFRRALIYNGSKSYPNHAK